MSDAPEPGPVDRAGTTRPSPQYGQYATPEEQQARIRQPDATVALDAGVSLTEVGAARSPSAPAPVAPRVPDSKPPRTVDRMVTLGLLAFGLINVVLTSFSLIDFPTVAAASMQMMGIPGDFTNIAQGRLLGAIAAVALVVGWVVTAWMALRRLRTGRITWWVPLVGAVGTYLVVYALLIPALLGDPAFMEYVYSSAS